MRPRGIFRVFGTFLVVMSLLLMATATSAWHRHDRASESHCIACQVVHHTVGQPLASLRLSAPRLFVWKSAPEDPVFQPSRVCRHTPSRSPPMV